jgi:crotonobetaine/carnitine-CoA ligase
MVWSAGDDNPTIGELLASVAARRCDEEFLDVVGVKLSFHDAYAAALRDAAALYASGIRFGDRVATIVDNSADAISIWLGANLFGAIEAPINTAYKGEFLRHQLGDSGASVIVADSGYVPRVIELLPQLPLVRLLVVRGDAPPSPRTTNSVELLSIDEWRAAAADLPADLPTPTRSDPAMFIYTAGTTGPSKACVVSHGYAVHQARRLAYVLDRNEGTVLYTPNPLFHLNAKTVAVLGTLLAGGRAVIDSRFSVSGFWPEINRTGATFASLIGAMIPLIADAPETEDEHRNTTLRVVAGTPFPPALVAKYEDRFGVRCLPAPVYGLTEAAPITVQDPHGAFPPRSSGKVDSAYWDVRIFDGADAELPIGEAGEIVCRPLAPEVMFSGYWARPEATLSTTRNLWFHTGDIGRFDEDGYIYFVDRKKDYLRRRGENISSFEVEMVFLQHPALAEVAVHAVPSELTEDDLKVTLVLRPDAELTEEELVRWSLDKLPYFAVPRYVEFRSVLPKSPVGRVYKYQLRDEGVTPKTFDVSIAGIEIKR